MTGNEGLQDVQAAWELYEHLVSKNGPEVKYAANILNEAEMIARDCGSSHRVADRIDLAMEKMASYEKSLNKKPKVKFALTYGVAGHENEYMVYKITAVKDFMGRTEEKCGASLDDFDYFDVNCFRSMLPRDHLPRSRGKRLEILGKRNDQLVAEKLKQYHEQLGMEAEIVFRN